MDDRLIHIRDCCHSVGPYNGLTISSGATPTFVQTTNCMRRLAASSWQLVRLPIVLGHFDDKPERNTETLCGYPGH